MIFAGAAIISAVLLSGGARAQGAPQTVDLVRVDVQKLAAGYRAAASSTMPMKRSVRLTTFW
jgi:outer membrane murein-binding lipoprotein Lpp